MPSTDIGNSSAMRRSIPPTSPLTTPCAIPANTNTTRSTPPRAAVVAYGPSPVMNQSAWTFGSVESKKKLKTPPTSHTTASTTQAVNPPTIASNPLDAASPTKLVTRSSAQPTGLGNPARITTRAPCRCG